MSFHMCVHQLEVGTHEQHSLEPGPHEPAPTNAQQAHYVKNIRGWTFMGASFKCVPFVGANCSMASV